jgi:hypothetical protein
MSPGPVPPHSTWHDPLPQVMSPVHESLPRQRMSQELARLQSTPPAQESLWSQLTRQGIPAGHSTSCGKSVMMQVPAEHPPVQASGQSSP